MEDFDFEKMYTMVTEMYKSSKEKCLVCHFVIESKEIQLDCTHQYHFNCLEIKKNYIICPYCGKNNKIKDTKDKCKFIMLSGLRKGLECERLNCGYHKNKQNNICQSIIKSGIKKGQVCNRNNCKYHNILV